MLAKTDYFLLILIALLAGLLIWFVTEGWDFHLNLEALR